MVTTGRATLYVSRWRVAPLPQQPHRPRGGPPNGKRFVIRSAPRAAAGLVAVPPTVRQAD